MASIRIEAQDVLDAAKDGIGWIAVWKNGRSWRTMTFWPDVDASGCPVFDAWELEGLANMLKVDPGAVIVNGYYHNLGDVERMTRDSLAAALRWHYERQTWTVRGYTEWSN